ncbi:MAG: site-specific integrase, partial [Pirellulales bacterium]|nr:site-specific integrase [Pirellulales bacterium]
DAQWRLLFALSRFGGLRCPSEHLGLRWRDVDWAGGRITVHSPKTEHHEGGASRQIPIFPELRPYLEEVWDQAEPGDEYVITRYRNDNANLRTQLERILYKAGLKPWPKLFQNLRSTRQTELAETYPMHVVCEWIGNSQAVAAKHYLQVTDEHFAHATRNPTPNRARKAVRNPVQQAHETSCRAKKPETRNPCFSEVFDGVQPLATPQVGDTGLEPVTPSLSS